MQKIGICTGIRGRYFRLSKAAKGKMLDEITPQSGHQAAT